LVELAFYVSELLNSARMEGRKIHFIGYSMGGLLVRVLLKICRPSNLGRVVFIGTPNSGSELADVFKNWWLFKKIYGPAGRDLCTTQERIKHLLSDTAFDYECGVVAGNRSLSLFAWLFMRSSNDGRVSTQSAKISGMRDFKLLRCSHRDLLKHPMVLENAVHFIENGIFRNNNY
jgi:pimeloyl-ACP methyl ester carboxylesterase